jgi:hypothetical protein
VIYVGVDPGKSGAIAILSEAGLVARIVPIPIRDDDYDHDALAAFFRELSDPRRADRGLVVTLERLDAMPMKFAKKGGRQTDDDAGTSGILANHWRGRSWAFLGMFAAFWIKPLLVRPQKWQKAMLDGMPGATWKDKSIAAAKRSWPGVNLRRTPRSKTDDDGFADALWIAEHGRRLHQGGHVFANASRVSGGGSMRDGVAPGMPAAGGVRESRR